MKPFEQQTYYELLEIPVTAPESEIHAAYARALETYSPDSVAVYALVDPGQLDALRARLTEAMEILTDSDLRAEYDRMIGLPPTEPSATATLAPALAAAAQAAPSEAAPSAPPRAESSATAEPEPTAPASPPPAAVSEASAAPAPAASAAPEPVAPAVPAPPVAAPAAESPPSRAASSPPEAAAPSEPPAALASAPVVVPVPPAQFVVPGEVSPRQIHAAFRSYAISYVPVLVPAPSLSAGSAFLSPFVPPPRMEVPPSSQEVPAPSMGSAPESTVAPAPPPSAELAQPPAPSTAAPVEAAPASASATASGPVASAEPVSAAPAPASTPAEGGQAAPAQASAEPPRAPEPAPAAAEPPAAVVVHNEEDELSGVRAPLPSRESAHATPSSPGRGYVPGRAGRVPTPPPLPPGGRRVHRAGPTEPAGGASTDPGKGGARPPSTAGMNLEEAQQIAQESAIATAEAALAQVAAKAREPRPKPIDLPPNTEFNGELLRRVRESRNLTLAQLSERTRISAKHLENVEADRYPALPATVYLRGILMNIARELGLDPLRVSRSYLALASVQKKK